MSKNNQYCIREFEGFYCGIGKAGKYTGLDQETFSELSDMVENTPDVDQRIMKIQYVPYHGKVIIAQNYVGVLSLNNGTSIEILPKIYSEKDDLKADMCREILMKILSRLEVFPFIPEKMAGIDTAKMKLFDIYVSVFLKEIKRIIQLGIRQEYEKVTQKGNVLKGRLLFKQQLEKNYVHKERFMISYSQFNLNTPQNRILKSTLVFLSFNVDNERLRQSIKECLVHFDSIQVSTAPSDDFKLCGQNRLTKYYEDALRIAEVFLKKSTFVNRSGSYNMPTLLFPMEKLFEAYVAKLIQNDQRFESYTLSAQDNMFHLLQHPKRYKLRPDLVLRKGAEAIIYDTKWKRLEFDEKYLVPSQSDLYQMYAYGKKYKAQVVGLIYPLYDAIQNVNSDLMKHAFEDDLILEIHFFDLEKDCFYKVADLQV